MPFLQEITIEGYKSIASIQKLKLNPINILIGANGSGKSNFIGVFDFLNRSLSENGLDEAVLRDGGANKILHFGAKLTSKIHFRLRFQDNYSFSTSFIPVGTDKLADASAWIPKDEDGLSEFTKMINSWRVYHFHDTGKTSPMKVFCKLNDNRYLRSDGSNLAALLYLIRERHNNDYRHIGRVIRQIAPFFQDFQLEPEKLRPDRLMLKWMHRGTDEDFDVGDFSDGTLRFIALATLLLQPKELMPSIIILDEPELGLHPAAITLLAAMIRIASHNVQLLIATQSSMLLDHFEPEDVLVAEREKEATVIKRITSQELDVWLEDYSLGQLWEKNYIGGRPGA